MPKKPAPAIDLHESCEPEDSPEAPASHQHEDEHAVSTDDDLVDEDALLLQAYERPAPSAEPSPLPMLHKKKKNGGAKPKSKPKSQPEAAKDPEPAPVLAPPQAAAPDDDDEGGEDRPPALDGDGPPAPPTQPPVPWTNENAGDPPPWAAELPQPVHDELALIVAVYPEATVYPVIISAATHAEEAAAAASYCACGDGDENPVDMTAMLSHVARLSLRIDGENVTVVLSALVPRGFGAVHGCNPSFEVRSPNAARTVVSSVEETLAEEVAEQCSEGAFSFLTFVGRASELVAGIPLGLQSDLFGFCLSCAAQSAKQAKLERQKLLAAGIDPATVPTSSSNRKYPQPLRVVSSVGGAGDGPANAADTADESAVVAAVRRETAARNNKFSDAPAYQCLACQSTTHVVRIPSLEANVKDEPCSFCYFEDNPIIRIAGCGCRTCFTCFSSFTSLSTGADQLRRCARTGWVGVTCPAHSTTSVITDPSLYKLCETSSFLRFNRFALQLATQDLNGTDCSDPRCSGIPTVSNITGNKTECSTCREWSCGTCNCFLRNCQCETWPNPTPRDHYVRSTAELITRRAQVYSSDRVEKRQVTMLLRFGHVSVAVTLDTADPRWYSDCRRQITEAQGAMTAEQWEGSFAKTRADAETSRFFVLFHGVPLDTSRMLGLYPVYDGAIVYAVVYTDLLGSKSLPSERDLFGFRVAIRAAGDGKKPESVASAEKGLYKRCPVCNKPVVHYFNHGCHHIGFASGKCCGHHWCYVCRGPYPCKKCPLMCNPHCGCPPCPDCKPSMPCGNCWGCQQCRGVNGGSGNGHEGLAIDVLDMFD